MRPGLPIRDDVAKPVELRRLARREPRRRTALRMLAIANALEGMSRADAARAVGMERQALRDAVVRYNAEGLAGLVDRPPGRRPERLSEGRAGGAGGPRPSRARSRAGGALGLDAARSCPVHRRPLRQDDAPRSPCRASCAGWACPSRRPVPAIRSATREPLKRSQKGAARGHEGGPGRPSEQRHPALVHGRDARRPERAHRATLVGLGQAPGGSLRPALRVRLSVRRRPTRHGPGLRPRSAVRVDHGHADVAGRLRRNPRSRARRPPSCSTGPDGTARRQLRVPPNVTLVPLPPYAPELNPIERVWLYLRERHLSHRLFADHDAVVDACCRAWNALIAEPGRIASLTSYPYLEKVNS